MRLCRRFFDNAFLLVYLCVLVYAQNFRHKNAFLDIFISAHTHIHFSYTRL